MVLGGPEETGQLLKHKFDYIFFTGEDGPGQDPGHGDSREHGVENKSRGGGVPEGGCPGPLRTLEIGSWVVRIGGAAQNLG